MYAKGESRTSRAGRSHTWKLVGGLMVLPVALGAAAASAANVMASPSQTPPADRSSVAAPSPLLDNTWGDDDTHEDEKATKATGSWEAKDDLGSPSLTRPSGTAPRTLGVRRTRRETRSPAAG